MLEAAALLDTVIGLFKRYKALIAIVPLLVIIAWLSIRLWGFLWWDGALDKVAKLETTVADISRASTANYDAQVAQAAKQLAKSTEQAKENVRVETQVRTVYRDRAADNAERMRLDKVCRSPTSAPGENPTAPQPDSPGATAVVLTRDDYDILVENSARLEAAHRWAKSLIEDGTAEVVKAGVPEVGFGQ